MGGTVEFILIPSTSCNLRCVYCDGGAGLARTDRLELPHLERVFRNLEAHFRDRPEVGLRFLWLGGEPLVNPPGYFWSAFALQREVFGPTGRRVVNSVQTNLTLLDEGRLRLLRDGFDAVGTSIDVGAGLRVDRSGASSEARVVRNVARAQAAGVRLGAIAVLTRANLPRLAEVYRFYRDHGLSLRLLPLRSAATAAAEELVVDAGQTLAALCELADLWLGDGGPIPVWPVAPLLADLLASRAPDFDGRLSTKAAGDELFLVDVDGSLYHGADPHDARHRLGNLLERPLAELLASPARRLAAAEAAARVERACQACAYFGTACGGAPVADGWEGPPPGDGAGDCRAFQGLFRHVERRLGQAGLLEPASGALTERGVAAATSLLREQRPAPAGAVAQA